MQYRRMIAAIVFIVSSVFSNANASDAGYLQHGQEPIHQVDAGQKAASLIDEVVVWISENFDLPAKPDRPQIRFATQIELMQIRIADLKRWQGFFREEPAAEKERNVVAVYDTSSRTVYLPEYWRGESPADQSILVHELVHHLQNIAGIKFECPAAREKAAYLAQDKWLSRFGKTLETEFDVDMFTVVVMSACM